MITSRLPILKDAVELQTECDALALRSAEGQLFPVGNFKMKTERKRIVNNIIHMFLHEEKQKD